MNGVRRAERTFVRSLGWAISGLRRTFEREPNFRRELAIGASAVALTVWLEAPLAPILVMCGLVLSLELVNSAVEAAVDLASPQQHELAGFAKDEALKFFGRPAGIPAGLDLTPWPAEKAEKIRPGAGEALKKKALQLTGGPDSPPPPKDRSVYGMVVAEGKADIFLTYCTNAVVAKRENPEQDIVALPEDVAVGANYGLTVMKDASAGAQKLADYILSPKGQSVLTSHGFAPPE